MHGQFLFYFISLSLSFTLYPSLFQFPSILNSPLSIHFSPLFPSLFHSLSLSFTLYPTLSLTLSLSLFFTYALSLSLYQSLYFALYSSLSLHLFFFVMLSISSLFSLQHMHLRDFLYYIMTRGLCLFAWWGLVAACCQPVKSDIKFSQNSLEADGSITL